MLDLCRTASGKPTLIVIGGGITGLAAATRIHRLAPQSRLILLEGSDRVGGLLRTHRDKGFVSEEAAENFLTQVPWGTELCRQIGLAGMLQATDPQNRGALVMRQGSLLPIPPGFAMVAPTRIWPILTTRILSLWGKLRLAYEPFVPVRQPQGDESIAAFVRRRLGGEAYERLVEPLVGSIYGTNPEQLSLAATLPQFAQMERTWGSLWRAQTARRNSQLHDKSSAIGANQDPFATIRSGMSSLVDALAARLDHRVQLESPVQNLRADNRGRWMVDVGGRKPRQFLADGVVLATPAFRSAQLLRDVDISLADELTRIDYRDVTLAAVAYRREQIAHPLDSQGIVIPQSERRPILSVSFSSVKYPDRAPEGTVLLRVSLRSAGEHATSELSDEKLQEIVQSELKQWLGVHGDPIYFRVVRHRQAMPVYRLGHPQRVSRLKLHVIQHQGLTLAGAAYEGSGVPQCIHSGEQAADNVLAHVRNTSQRNDLDCVSPHSFPT